MCKIPLSSGCTCPNRDGTLGFGGCYFCTGDGGSEFAPKSTAPLIEQYQRGREKLQDKWRGAGFIAYFQSFSNTYTSTEKLEKLLGEAFALPQIEALRISTRADCIDPSKVEILKAYSKKIPLVVELGLQTIFDETALRLNRCHSYEDFLKGYKLLEAGDIPVSVHIINGLPYETPLMMLETAKALGKLSPFAIKIHALHILKGSALGAIYEKSPFKLQERSEYIETLVSQLELIPPSTVIERVTGDGSGENLIAPQWTKNKLTIINDIDKELLRRDSFQGRLF